MFSLVVKIDQSSSIALRLAILKTVDQAGQHAADFLEPTFEICVTRILD